MGHMKTYNVFKYEVRTRKRFSTTYERTILTSLREYTDMSQINFFSDDIVVLGYEMIEPTLRKVIEENPINWN